MLDLNSPINVTLETTARCNIDCFFCEPKLAEHRGPEYVSKEMSTDQIFKIIDKLADANILELNITGGEPTLRKDLTSIIERCFDYDIYPELVTNGVAIDGELVGGLQKSGLEWLQVSLQGPPQIHDEIVRTPGSYERTVKGIRHLKGKLNVVVSSVVSEKNYAYLPQLLTTLCEEKLVDSYRTLKLMPLSIENLEQVVEPAKIRVLNEEIKEIVTKFGIDVMDLYSGLEKCEKSTKYSQTMCRAGKTDFSILSDGSVIPCKTLKGREFVVGNILEHDMEFLWNHSIMKMFRELDPDKYQGECGKCFSKWNCYSCRAIAYNLTGNLYGDDLTCFDLLKQFK